MSEQVRPRPQLDPTLAEAAASREKSRDSFESISLDSPTEEEKRGLSADQREVFLHIYHLLETSSAIAIVSQKSKIEALAKKVEEVSPMLFLDFLKESPRLKHSLKIVEAKSHDWPFLLRAHLTHKA